MRKFVKVLVVDDENVIADLIRDQLKARGDYDISLAYSGTEALTKIGEDKPDLVILDIAMPGLSGLEMLDILRKKSETADIPVILASAIDCPPFEERKRLGVVEFLKKPLDFTKLNQIICELDSPEAPSGSSQN